MIVQKKLPGKLFETKITAEILFDRMDENVMGFRFGRFEHFVTDLTPEIGIELLPNDAGFEYKFTTH